MFWNSNAIDTIIMSREDYIHIGASNYSAAESWCTKVVKSGHGLLFDVDTFIVQMKSASKKFQFPAESLNSFLRNAHLKHIKKQTYSIKNKLDREIIPKYERGASILHLSMEYNFPPAMMSRNIVEKVTKLPKKKISDIMKNPLEKLELLIETEVSNTAVNADADEIGHGNEIAQSISGRVEGNGKDGRSLLLSQNANCENFDYDGSTTADAATATDPFNACNQDIQVREVIDSFSGEVIDFCSTNSSNGNNNNDKNNSQSNEKVMTLQRLRREVVEAINSDPLYGPRSDRERQIIGVEYEIILEQTLRSMGISFETERELKKRGTSKTPDILFSCPVGVKVPKINLKQKQSVKNNGSDGTCTAHSDYEWKMICWIDSKALFGDVNTHQKSVLPQAEGYVHRFGPGLVLYWFGHAPSKWLGDGHGDVIIKAWKVPTEFMMPTGDIVRIGWKSKYLVDDD